MKTVYYRGPYDEGVEIPLPTGGIHALPGEPVEVPDDVADGLLLQEDIWSASAQAPPAPPAPSKAIREFAAEKGVDLATVTGTGVGGRILKKDVKAAAEKPAVSDESNQPAEGTTKEE